MEKREIKIQYSDECQKYIQENKVEYPKYETEGSAGFDLRAISFEFNGDCYCDDIILLPGRRTLIKTGLFVEIPKGYELQIRPRSGLALKHGIAVLNSPGTIDGDYRGEIGVILINHGYEPFEIKIGDRIAQAVLVPITQAAFKVVDKLGQTERGEGGFGSTGK